MTQEEYKVKSKELHDQRARELNEATQKVYEKYQPLYDELNKTQIDRLNEECVEIGDIITDGETIIEVKKMLYVSSIIKDDDYIEYRGTALTKQLKPKKNQDWAYTFIQRRYGKVPTIIKKRQNE